MTSAQLSSNKLTIIDLCKQARDTVTSGNVDTTAIYTYLEMLEWPGQQATATRAACTLYQRLLRHRKTKEQAKIATRRLLDDEHRQISRRNIDGWRDRDRADDKR